MNNLQGTPFDLTDRVIVITGGAGFLGRQHAKAITLAGGIPVLFDLPASKPEAAARDCGGCVFGCSGDVTSPVSLKRALDRVLKKFKRLDGLVNNAALNPQVKKGGLAASGRLEHLDPKMFSLELEVGLSGAVYASQVFGSYLAEQGHGVIVNIASDLALIAPDQRIYRKEGLAANAQPTKPVSYSVVKAGLIGLTRYLATYWPEQGIRVNALCPGGVERDQDPAFRRKLSKLIPLGRMARADEYGATLIYLLSDASSYMTGSILSVDGGRTTW